TFDLLGPDFTAGHIRQCVGSFQKVVTDGWVCRAFSNHDVDRHVSRFVHAPEEPERVAKLAIPRRPPRRGSVRLPQGEELGLTEAALAFEDLRDPYGIRFWPAFKGRDGCRTPMPWQQAAAHAGFSTAKPWLPVPADHTRLAVDAQEKTAGSVLNHYRETLAFRRAHAALTDGDMAFLPSNQDLLAFTREKAGERLLFVFNLTREKAAFMPPKTLKHGEPVPVPGFGAKIKDGAI